MATSVSYIHGLPQRPPDEWADRARNTMPPIRFSPGLYTVGENRLILLADQAQLLAQFYPDDRQAATDLRALLEAIEAGVHGQYTIPKGVSPAISKYIQEARRLRTPEGLTRTGLAGGVLVPYEDCQAFMTQTVDPYSQTGEVIYGENASSIDCRERNEDIRVLNQYLEPSAPHILYNFVRNANATTPIVAAKSVIQKSAAQAMAKTFAFDNTNFQLWLRNGVMRANTRQDIPPVSPEQSIELLRTRDQDGVGIDPATLALILGIGKAIVAAIGATSVLLATIKAAKQQKIIAAAEGLGNASFGPEPGDFGSGAGNTGSGGTDPQSLKKYLPLALGAAAAYLLTD